MKIDSLDHLVLTVADIDATIAFYAHVPRTGATAPIRPVYCRDPDGNLVEVANVQPAA
ncbi:hypothetical protein [Thauera linaloolentis]|uniref:Hydrolase n=1 Tax=Thauera linaloolentis (strain DSM 12138 / JCM 21573 / CCUG 41526 / CIP 105981 / IAM 15112 / NBRC 102519 / 47Lol) TaxID=1123367 RepID=N6YPF6_THAL4|nr:hypothetical protein [Thauera linaloolentis]ENO84088.1 hydrolase [Thauera linaloolentis 47Lol = DSM 12138]MCM8564341.1 hypothetical protein [Thauera linaloolentis]